VGFGRSPDARVKAMRQRLGVLGWCIALITIAASLMNLGDAATAPDFWGFAGYADNRLWALGIPLAAGLVALWRPRLAALIAPWALLLIGLFGILARQAYIPYSLMFFDEVSYWLAEAAGHPDYTQFLIMPMAFLSVLVGARMAVRDLTTRSWAAPLLGRLAGPVTPSRRWSLLLLPATATATLLFQPHVVAHGSPLVLFIWLVAWLPAVMQIIRKSPGLAAVLGTVGVVTFALASLWLYRVWAPGGWVPWDWRPTGFLHSSILQAAYVGFGCWVASQLWPEARGMLGRLVGVDSVSRRQLTGSHSDAADTGAVDLRRIERNPNAGAQATLVALGMNLRAAERLIPDCPDAAIALVAEARETSARALIELREPASGVHPPVQADQGLADAIRALALESSLRVQTDIDLPGRIPVPVETACYLAVAEALTNAAKHSGASEAQICMSHSGGMLRIEVTDFGRGGAHPVGGSGLAAAERRLAALDGILAISSPTGGPTIVVVEVPCAPQGVQ